MMTLVHSDLEINILGTVSMILSYEVLPNDSTLWPWISNPSLNYMLQLLTLKTPNFILPTRLQIDLEISEIDFTEWYDNFDIETTEIYFYRIIWQFDLEITEIYFYRIISQNLSVKRPWHIPYSLSIIRRTFDPKL